MVLDLLELLSNLYCQRCFIYSSGDAIHRCEKRFFTFFILVTFLRFLRFFNFHNVFFINKKRYINNV